MKLYSRDLANALIRLGQNTFLGRGLARRVLLRAIEVSHPGPFDTMFKGVPITLYLDNTTERKALFGRYDWTELNFLVEHLTQSGTFVDVGANSGLYTQIVAAKTSATVIAIEPNSVMCERICHNLLLLCPAARNRVSVVECAVGSASGAMHLNTTTGFGTARLEPATDGQTIVPVEPLASILSSYNVIEIDAMKIDIEGFESEVLIPFFDTADEKLYPKCLVIEHTSAAEWKIDLIEYLKTLGYKEVNRTRGNALLLRG